MKKYNKYFLGAMLAGAMTLSLTSCDLEEYNPGGETADEVFQTAEGMEYLVNQMYYNFRWKYYGREDPVLYMEGAADIWQNCPDKYEYGMQLTRCVNLQGDRGQIAGVWNRVYDNINVCNSVINRIDEVALIEDAAKKSFEGEARFMRSYCYWWLVEFFGDIELRLEETNKPQFTAVRTDRKKIYDDVIIPDAKKAADLLPVDPYKGDIGRSTKKAAKALLARVLLTRASYETAGSEEQKEFYRQAYAAANDVMTNKAQYGIELYKTYDEIWQAKNNKNNTEFLWVCSHSSNSNYNPQPKNPNRLHLYFAPRLKDHAGIEVTATSWEYTSESVLLMPTYYFMNLWQDWDQRYDVLFQEAFLENADRGFYKWTPAEANRYLRADLINKRIMTGDTAMYFTKGSVSDEFKLSKKYVTIDIDDLYETENVNQFGGAKVRNFKDASYMVGEGETASSADADHSKTTQYICTSFPRFRKYRVWDRIQPEDGGTVLIQAANGATGFGDVPLMRYAEIPLIAAECQIGLGNAAEAAKIINAEIRNERVVKPGHALSEAQVAASDMNIEWIMEERARELCGEWLRWFDVKRVYAPQGNYATTIMGRNPSMINDDCMQEFHALRPIPNTFLDKLENRDEFGQNPGYN